MRSLWLLFSNCKMTVIFWFTDFFTSVTKFINERNNFYTIFYYLIGVFNSKHPTPTEYNGRQIRATFAPVQPKFQLPNKCENIDTLHKSHSSRLAHKIFDASAHALALQHEEIAQTASWLSNSSLYNLTQLRSHNSMKLFYVIIEMSESKWITYFFSSFYPMKMNDIAVGRSSLKMGAGSQSSVYLFMGVRV